MKKIIVLSSCLIILFVFVIGVIMSISYENKSQRLKNEAKAQNGKIEAVYDNMWKILSQKAEVADQYKDAFAKIYPSLIEGRYSKGDGSLMKWIQESNPNFDVSLYKDIMQSIEIQRTAFLQAQERMLDIIREHDNLITTLPGRWFIGDRTHIKYIVISSTKSKQVMESRLDDDVKLFSK